MTIEDTNTDLAVQLETLAKELRELDARNRSSSNSQLSAGSS